MFTIFLTLAFLIDQHAILGIPACIIIDTNMIPKTDNELISSANRSSSSLLLRNLRMLDPQRSNSAFLLDPIPLSHIDIKQTTTPSSSSSIHNTTHLSSKKSVSNAVNSDQTFSPCSIKLLNEIETQMVVPFEFRRLRIEQADHRTKYLDDDPRENVLDLSTAVYERRSDPEGLRFCRTCRDGKFNHFSSSTSISSNRFLDTIDHL